jgi:two-component system cell cycle response regulator DivK
MFWRVLYIEDDPSSMLLIYRIVVRLGYDMVQATNGLEGLEAAERSKPQLILTDINLPYLDGIEVTRQLKSNPELAGIPVIAITGQSDPGWERACLEAGCEAFITKPIDTRYLRDLIRSYVEGTDSHR